MPSKSSPRVALTDLARNIRLAQTFVAGMEYHTFCEDRRTAYAVTRCLEIVSEASRRLSDDVKERHPQIPWNDIAGAGNVYRHDYEDVQESILWHTVQHDLPSLLQAVDIELTRFPEE
jgi:uncharacterized protein with HEPN domain